MAASSLHVFKVRSQDGVKQTPPIGATFPDQLTHRNKVITAKMPLPEWGSVYGGVELDPFSPSVPPPAAV